MTPFDPARAYKLPEGQKESGIYADGSPKSISGKLSARSSLDCSLLNFQPDYAGPYASKMTA